MSIQSGAIPLEDIVEQPGPALACWAPVNNCPVCASDRVEAAAALPDRHYVFGEKRVPFPDTGITVNGCGVCGAYYKSMVPTSGFLAGMFEQHAEDKWGAYHDLSYEVATLHRLWGDRTLNLLDVGAAGGSLLKAHEAGGLTGRRSALDVMRYAGIESNVTGEFIQGFLDDPLLGWSRDPYDVVTLFDVVEHLYRPRDAFENLRALTRPGGLVFIETGNVDCYWSRRFGINQWWYVRLLEHHVFWSRRALTFAAAAHGFKLVYWMEGRHKSRRHRAPTRWIGDFAKAGLYYVAGSQYSAIAQAFGKQGNQPWFPFARDHFQACLMRE